MGSRSTFISQDYDISWPEWFFDKYQKSTNFYSRGRGVISSKYEIKMRDLCIENDIQRAIDWDNFRPANFIVVFLHECGGLTRCQIERYAIKYSEPVRYTVTDGSTHHYCDGCSDV